MAGIGADTVREYFGRVAAFDLRGALAVARGLLADGVDPEQVVLELIARSQREVGQLWEQGRWSVAQEHAATGLNEAVLATIPVGAPHQRETVMLGCVEQEWHSLPARIMAQLLRLRGWDTIFLGASTPTDAFVSLVAGRAAVLALSSTTVATLPSAARAIAVAHAAGLCALVGGAGFGDDGVYAERLGADGWAQDADGASRLLEEWSEMRPGLGASRLLLRGEHLEVAARREMLCAAADRRLAETLAEDDREWFAAHVAHTVAVLEAALLTDDEGLFADHLRWLGRMLHAWQKPSQPLHVALAAASDALPREAQRARRLLAEAPAALG